MSEKAKNPESKSFGDRLLGTAEKYNSITAKLGVVATAASAFILKSPELTVFFGAATALDVATGGLIKSIRNRRKNKKAAALAGT